MEKRVVSTTAGSSLEVLTEKGFFGKVTAALKGEGVGLIAAEQLALIRMSDGPKRPFSKEGTWIAENYNYATNGDILIASGDYNPLLRSPAEAARAHRQGKEFYLDAKALDGLLKAAKEDPEEAVKTGVLLLRRKDVTTEIPTPQLAESPVCLFLFRSQAKAYGEWLSAQGVESVPQWVVPQDYASKQPRSFGRTLWVHSLNNRSALKSTDDLHTAYGRGRAMRESPAELAAQLAAKY